MRESVAVMERSAPVERINQPNNEAEEITISGVARGCFDKSGGDIQKAARLMVKEFRRDEKLLMLFSEHCIRLTCVEAVKTICRSERRSTWLPPNYDAGGNGARVLALAKSNSEMLLDFPLWGGKKLRDATKDDVAESAAKWTAQGKDMMSKGRWLSLVASRVPEKKTVGQALTETELRKLHKEATNA